MPNGKKLVFDKQNFLIGTSLLIALNVIGINFVDPSKPFGGLFYFSAAFLTAFMFPFLKVTEKDEEKER